MNRPRLLQATLVCLLIFQTTMTGAQSLSPAQEVERSTVELKTGGSELVRTAHSFSRISIADPEVADIVVLSPRELYVYGKRVGYTSLILWQGNEGRTLVDVQVGLDLVALKEQLHQLYPREKIEVHAAESGMVLAGTVSGPEVMEEILRLANTYLPSADRGKAEGTGRSGSSITNLLKVGGIQQVLLEVKFAEVARTSGRDWQGAMGLAGLGKDFTGAIGTNPVLSPIQLEKSFISPLYPQLGRHLTEFTGPVDGIIQNPGSLLMNFVGNPANIFVNIDNFSAALRFLEDEGLARTLAEPRLVTMSGQEASFLAGGEFPIPVPQGDGQGITIEFRQFGVGLRFTPVVLSDGRISLKVAPSVSEIASASVIPAGIQGSSFIVPNLSTRKLETTVEMYDGQTLALAGLLQENMRQSVQKIPGLGDIPILGSLFRSNNYRQEKTDLLIAVTPHLVKPVREGELSFPGEFMQAPTRYEFYMEGRLEGRRHAGDPSGLSRHRFQQPSSYGGLEGDFGYRPVSTE
jgi:pilus assembly protein CpaC